MDAVFLVVRYWNGNWIRKSLAEGTALQLCVGDCQETVILSSTGFETRHLASIATRPLLKDSRCIFDFFSNRSCNSPIVIVASIRKLAHIAVIGLDRKPLFVLNIEASMEVVHDLAQSIAVSTSNSITHFNTSTVTRTLPIPCIACASRML